jgi:hypothetical protein
MVSKAKHDVDRRIRQSFGRSAVSNGRTMPDEVDGRSKIVRRFKDISAAILTDQGGAEHCAEARLQLIRRFAACAVMAEMHETKLAGGGTINAGEYALLCGSLVRIARQIGIGRRSKNITPNLAQYLDAVADQQDGSTYADEDAATDQGSATEGSGST